MTKFHVKLAWAILSTSLIAGCGADSDVELISSEPIDRHIASLEGVRYIVKDTDDGIDESYVSIDSNGYILVYDYQGDAAGTGENCYTYAFNPLQTNSMIHRAQISYKLVEELPPEYYESSYPIEEKYRYPEENTRFTITSDPDVGDYEIEFNSSQYSNGMYDYLYSNIFYTTNLGLTDSASGYNFRLRTPENNTFRAGDILASDLEAALCRSN